MSKEAKVILTISVVFLIIFAGFIYLATRSNTVKNPEPVAVDASLLIKKDNYQTSPNNAKVTIVEFGDFQCPSCAQVYPALKELLKIYQDKLNLVFRNFPLPQHKNANVAAEAALAAGSQGKFWEMYDKLYENQNKWSESNNALDVFNGYAKDIGLDVNKFTQDVKGEKFKDVIASDLNDGTLLGIDATPTFFIDGRKTVGILDLNQMKSLIDQKLPQTPSK